MKKLWSSLIVIVHSRRFDIDQDQHPVKYLVAKMTDGIYNPILDWMVGTVGVVMKDANYIEIEVPLSAKYSVVCNKWYEMMMMIIIIITIITIKQSFIK